MLMFKCPWRKFYPRIRACSSDVTTRTASSFSFTCHSLVGASLELVSIKCHQTLSTRGRLGFQVKCLSVFVSQVQLCLFVYEMSMVEILIAAETGGLRSL